MFRLLILTALFFVGNCFSAKAADTDAISQAMLDKIIDNIEEENTDYYHHLNSDIFNRTDGQYSSRHTGDPLHFEINHHHSTFSEKSKSAKPHIILKEIK